MRLAKVMNAEKLARLLASKKCGEVVEFGLEAAERANGEPLETYDVECWFFVKRMYIDGYDSDFFLCDYCGGGEAFAIPLFDGWDETDLKSDVERMFDHIGDMVGYKVSEVYVDMGESEE